MDIFEIFEKRRSIRTYENKPIEDDKLRKVLMAAQNAPTSYNNQNFKLIVVKDKEKIKKLVYACKQQEFVADAPVVIVACGLECDHKMTCGQYAYTIDTTIVMTHIMLAASALELGTCWLGSFYEDKVRKVLKIPEENRVVSILTLGYPRYKPAKTSRKSLANLVSFDKWS